MSLLSRAGQAGLLRRSRLPVTPVWLAVAGEPFSAPPFVDRPPQNELDLGVDAAEVLGRPTVDFLPELRAEA